MIINIEKSDILTSGLVFAHCGALALLILAPLPAILIWIVSAMVIVHCVVTLSRYARLSSKQSIIALSLSDGGISIRKRCKDESEICSLVNCFIGRHFAVLKLKLEDEGNRAAVLVMADACSPQDFRRLRKYLRLHSNSLRGF